MSIPMAGDTSAQLLGTEEMLFGEFDVTTPSTNVTGPRECEFQTLRALIMIPFALIFVVSVPGNLLVITAIHRERRLQNPTNVFVTGLAVADIINGLFSIPCAYFWFVSYCDTVIVLYCRFLARTCCACSVVHLVLVSVDRYIAVAKPLKYPSLLTRSRAKKSSAIAWAVIILYMCVIVVLYHLTIVYDYLKYDEGTPFQIFWNYFPSSMILVAMVVTSVIYGYVLYQAHQLRGRMKSMMKKHVPAASIRTTNRAKQLRATKTLAIVVLAFAICWLPISVTIFIEVGPSYDPGLSLAPTLFYYANSVMNPLIFAYRSRDFREAFKSILAALLCCFTTKPAMLRGRSGRPSVTSDRGSHRGSSQKQSSCGVENPAATNQNMTHDV
ncbi:adenosine receptor A2b-like [Diadema setosum]|uniref:adenosine receptor A2b-like n=1 Tax=Diadema setosum TaxID=31175 RepID=UPI003B3A0E0D